MGYLNDLINSGRLKSNPLSGLQQNTPPASIAAPNPIVASPAPVLNYAKPAVTTMPAYSPAPQQAVYRQPVYNQNPVAQAPVTPPAPPKPKPIAYGEFTDGMAATDAPFVEQRSLFNAALDKFLAEHKRQTETVNADATTAFDGVERNRVAGLTSLNEDLAARGLGRGGIALDQNRQASDQYGRQKINVQQGLDRSLGDLNARKEKMQSDTAQNIQAARREAYNRLVAKQELV